MQHMECEVSSEVTTVAKCGAVLRIRTEWIAVAQVGHRQDNESACPESGLPVPLNAAPRAGMGAV